MTERPNDRDAFADEQHLAESRGLSRRNFVGAFGLAAAAGGVLAACSSDDGAGSVSGDSTDPAGSTASTGDADLDDALQASDLPDIEWDMATSWPIVLDTIYGGAVYFGERVAALTGGRFKITAAPGGELVPALEILQSVQTGAVASGHTAAYYYTGLDPITQLSTCVPFGMNARGHISWMTEGGGLDLIQASVSASGSASSPSRRATPAARWVAGSIRRSRASTTSAVCG